MSTGKEPTAAALRDAENAVFMLEMLAGEHDRHGLHYSVIEETVVEQGFYASPVSASYTLTWLGKAEWVMIPQTGFRKLTEAGRALLADHPDRAELARHVRAEFDRIDAEIQSSVRPQGRKQPEPREFVCKGCGLIKPEHQRTPSGVCRDCE
jgi:hypothetical protein